MIIRYAIDSDTPVEEFRDRLLRNFNCERTARQLESTAGQVHRRYYLDTLDWRLYRKGYQLEAIEQGKEQGKEVQLELKTDEGELVCCGYCKSLPSLVDTLPKGKLKDLLDPVLGVRALVKQLNLRVRQDRIAIIDKNQKTIANVIIETTRILHPATKTRVLKNLFFAPLKGFETKAGVIRRFLDKQPGLLEEDVSFFQYCLEIAKIDLQRFSNKLRVILEQAQRSDMAVKTILFQMVPMLQVNRQPIIEDIDSECLHDFRIAIRRTRVALKQLPGLFPVRMVESFSSQFNKLGVLTTSLRDLDVVLQGFDKYVEMNPDVESCHLQILKEHLHKERNLALDKLSRYLASSGFNNFLSRWQSFLTEGVVPASRLRNAQTPIGTFITDRTRKNYKKVLRKGRNINVDTPDDELHELRKECKKLRYLLEFGQSIYPKKEFKKAVKIIKNLQDVLGRFQDLSVHIALFARVKQSMGRQGRLPEGTIRAIEIIVCRLESQQQLVRGQFEKTFQLFASEKNQRIFSELLSNENNCAV